MKPVTHTTDLRVGDVIVNLETGHKEIILKLGRGPTRSAVTFQEVTKRHRIFLEIDFWVKKRWVLHSRIPNNVKWAKEYVAQHQRELPLV